MATPEQRDAYRRVVNLILEEIEGCELPQDSTSRANLMEIVSEFERRIIYDLELSPRGWQTPQVKPANKPRPKHQPKPKKVKAWQHGPLAAASAGPIPKPPWFTA